MKRNYAQILALDYELLQLFLNVDKLVNIVLFIIIYSTNEINETLLYVTLCIYSKLFLQSCVNQIDYCKIVDSSYHYHN